MHAARRVPATPSLPGCSTVTVRRAIRERDRGGIRQPPLELAYRDELAAADAKRELVLEHDFCSGMQIIGLRVLSVKRAGALKPGQGLAATPGEFAPAPQKDCSRRRPARHPSGCTSDESRSRAVAAMQDLARNGCGDSTPATDDPVAEAD